MIQSLRLTIAIGAALASQVALSSPPLAPQVSIETDGVQLKASWVSVDGAAGYNFLYAPAPYEGEHTIESINLGNVNEFGADLWEGAAFFLAVEAYSSEGISPYSNILEFKITDESIIRDFEKVSAPDATEWNKYSSVLSQIAGYYEGLPTTINVDNGWFSSLQISPDKFSTRTDTFEVSNNISKHGVGYGSYAKLSESSEMVFYSNWVYQVSNAGSAFAITYENGVPKVMDYLPIEGSTHNWVLDNGDGTQSVVFVGVDEGKIAQGEQANSPTYFYDIENKSWSQSDYLTASHNSIPYDIDNDGDMDIVAHTWDEPFDNRFIILLNEGGEFTPVPLPYMNHIRGSNAVGVLGFQDDGTFDVVIGDALILDSVGIEPKMNIIASYSSDLSTFLGAEVLPKPYFERDEFIGVEPSNKSWKDTVGLSHDVSAKGIDVDYDGDTDIIISSLLWSRDNPYGVLQILINDNGTYVDETDTRLINWQLVGNGSHRLDFVDVNFDGFVDILASDNAFPAKFDNSEIDAAYVSGSRVLINDGTGHFATIVHQQINETGEYLRSHVPSLNNKGELKWTVIKPDGSATVDVITRSLNMKLSTGPNGIDPAKYGAPGFNEFYYLLHNEDVRNAVSGGALGSGLEHYLRSGRDEGRVPHAIKMKAN